MWLRAVHRGHVNQMVFVLEVVRFIADSEEGRAKGVTLEHVGYMRASFKTKMDAASYYDRHNHHMRCLNAHKTWCSDWDPSTRLKYIVREWHDIFQSVPPFDTRDEPAVSCSGGVTEIIYPYLN